LGYPEQLIFGDTTGIDFVVEGIVETCSKVFEMR
jgi:hypothetical protein